MSIILHIESAIEGASVCVANDGKYIDHLHNPVIKDSAAWLHVGIETLLRKNDLTLKDLAAVAVSAGPGSYTGLRVGMAAAKGLCFALQLPLLCISTLQSMASAAKNINNENLLCPMIDARRMEVFTAVYDQQLLVVMPPKNMILDSNSFQELLSNEPVVFFGNGSKKFQSLVHHSQAIFTEVEMSAVNMIPLAQKAYLQQQFEDLAYSEPYYGKEFYTPVQKKPF